MLQVNPYRVLLKPFQKRYNVQITNEGDQPIIFKIRSTNVEAFTVEPNIGFLKTETHLSLLITLTSRIYMNGKIQINYATLENPSLTFEEAWAQLKKTDSMIKSQIVYICSPEEDQQKQKEDQNQIILNDSFLTNTRQSRRTKLKSQHDKLKSQYDTKNKTSDYIKKQTLGIIEEQLQFKEFITGKKVTKSKEKILQHYQRQKKRHFDEEQREEMIYRIQEMERKLNRQINKTSRYEQQLKIAEKKIKEALVQGLKYQLGTVGVICQERHISFTGLSLLALAAFSAGYALAFVS